MGDTKGSVDNNKRRVGNDYEEKAAKYLESVGYKVTERNFYCKFGEIDIIAEDGDYLCFVEVKYRKAAVSGYPEEAVDARKIAKISKSAMQYISNNRISLTKGIRFDVIAIDGGNIRLIKNAFEYCGYWK